MSSGRRRPGVFGAVALLLLGTVFLGVGVLLHLYDGEDRRLVARDLGDVPGPVPAASAPRPLSEDIPVLSGLDELVPGAGGRAGAVDGVDRVDGGFAAPSPTGAPGPGRDLTPTAAAASRGSAEPAPSEPTTAEPTPQLADPAPEPVPARRSPRPLPRPEPSLGPQEPGLVSALHPLPTPTAAGAPRSPLVPARLELAARSVTAPVDSVGTGPNGGMVVPDEVRTVGWWAPGVLPGGTTGSAVIAGHVDSRTGGLGVLSVLPQLTDGEPVLVGDASGRTVAFRVAARREYGKYDLPRDVFRRDGAPQLVLITCGGVFDPVARSYESNIVVYAVPA